MDPAAYAAAQETLLPGEQILWACRPATDLRPFWNRLNARTVIGLIVATILIAVCLQSTTALYMVIPLALVGTFTVNIVVIRRRYFGKAAWNAHVVTNQRVIHVFSRGSFRQVTSAPLNELTKIRMGPGNQEAGDINFWRTLEDHFGKWKSSWEGKMGVQMLSAKHPHYVRDLCQWVIDNNAGPVQQNGTPNWSQTLLDRTG